MTDPTRPLHDSDESLFDRLMAQYFSTRESGESPVLDDYLRQLATDSERDLFVKLVDTGDAEIKQFINEVQPGTVLSERYRLDKKIGEGGMGQVWAAHDNHLDRIVAVKILNSNACMSLDSVENIQRETQLMQQINHPGIASVHDFCSDGAMTYFAMEHVDGVPLSDVIEQASQLAVKPSAREMMRIIDRDPAHEEDQILGNEDWYRSVARVTVAILRILEAAHLKGIVHRDLKPNNIMLCGGGKPMLLDFGLGRTLDTKSRDITQGLFGTLFYVAPEQVESKQSGINPRSDVYQMGAVLYEFLTLKRAIKGDSISEVLNHISRGDVEMPRKLDEHVPKELQDICLKALEHNIDRRYASARAFREDLERYLSGNELPTACRGSIARKARYFVRRNRTLTIVAATVLVTTALTWSLTSRQPASTFSQDFDPTQAPASRGAGDSTPALRQISTEVQLTATGIVEVFAMALFQSEDTEYCLPLQVGHNGKTGDTATVPEGVHVLQLQSKPGVADLHEETKGTIHAWSMSDNRDRLKSQDAWQTLIATAEMQSGRVPRGQVQKILDGFDARTRDAGSKYEGARDIGNLLDTKPGDGRTLSKITLSF